MMFQKIVFFFTMIFSVSVFSEEKQPVFTSSKLPIIVTQKNPVFTIKLQSNPTTGFLWKLASYDRNLMTLVDHTFVAPKNKKLLGAPGYDMWTFKAKYAHYAVNQVGHVRMLHARPWTSAGATKMNFIIIVKK